MKICLWKSKNKNAGTLSQKSKFCETQYAEMDNHTGKKKIPLERTVATELSVPNMHIKDTQGF